MNKYAPVLYVSLYYKIVVLRSLPIFIIIPLGIALVVQAQVQLVPLLKRFQNVPEI